jgi:PTH1 family peptidyl-tRNA hydrolase
VLVVVGLGNPGPTYAHNRHNVGFRVASAFRETAGLERFRREGEVEVSRGRRLGKPVVVARPLGYMNRSGEAIAALLGRERADTADLLVVADDIYLPLAKLRLRRQGGDGGHNGLGSIIESLGGDAFPRLRFGVGGVPPEHDMREWVLEDFTAEEERAIEPAIERAVAVIDSVLREGFDRAMNRCNAQEREVAP